MLSASHEPESLQHTKEFESDEKMSRSLWYALAVKLLEPKIGMCVLLITTGLCAPVCAYCLSVETSIDFDMSVPSEAKTYDVFKDVEKEFGAGAVFPYKLLFVPKFDLCPGANPLMGLCEAGVTNCDAGMMCDNGLSLMNDALVAIAKAGQKHSQVNSPFDLMP